MILAEATLVDGQVLGGNSSFLNNVYGDLTRNGNTRLMRSNIEFGSRLDLDMRFLTNAPSDATYGGMNLYNTLSTRQNTAYSRVEPVFNTTTYTIHQSIYQVQHKTTQQ